MSAGSQHGVRPTAEAFLVCKMKLRRCGSEPVKIASDVIQRDQAVVAIKGCVFQAFGHPPAGELLEFHGEGSHCLPISPILSLRAARQKPSADPTQNSLI